MPRIINAYADGNSSIADSLSKLGEAIYGDQAKNEVYRQKAFGSKRENDSIPLLADAVARGDRNEISRQGVMSGKTGDDTGAFNRLGVSNHASSVDDPRLALSMLGAGGSFANTAPGQGRELANRVTTTGMNNASAERIGAGNNATSLEVGVGNNDASRDVAHIQADKTAASDKYRFDNTHVNTYDPASGRTVLTPQSQAAGREVAPTKEGVVGGMLRRVATDQQPGAPAAASGDPFGGMSPRWQKIAGVELPEQSLIEPRSGQTAISRDGGVTAELPDGRKVPGTGFQPVDSGAALGQARDNNVRTQAAAPLAAVDPTKSQAAVDASQASGLGAFVQKHANAELGGLPGGSKLINAVSGSPEIAPATQRAQERINLRNNAARTILLGGAGRQTDQAREWVNRLLPQGAALTNPATEGQNVSTIVQALKEDHAQIQQTATDPNTPPADRVKMVQQLRQIENVVRMFGEPAAGQPAAAPPAAAAAPAPQPAQAVAAPPPAPKIGEMRDGYAFQGGDPANPQSWMQVQ